MPRIAVFAVIASLIISLAAVPVGVSAIKTDNDPGDRSNTGNVHTSGVSGTDQYSIMQVGPSGTDWMGLSRSSAYWVEGRTGGDANLQAQSIAVRSKPGNQWGWLGLLGLAGLLWGLANKSRLR